MSYPAKKTTLLYELESAIKRKTQEKNRHRDMANKNLQYSIEKKKNPNGTQSNTNQSRERVPSASTHKNSKNIQLQIEKKGFENKPISIFNNLHSQGNGLVSEQLKESLAKESIAHAAKAKKTNSKKLDKLVSLINYAVSSAQKIIKYMNASSFQGQFAIKLFRSDKENLLNQLKNLTVEDIIQHRDRNTNSGYNIQKLSNDKDLNQIIIDLQNDNIKLKSKIATLEKQCEAIEKVKRFQDIFQVPTGKSKETQRFKQTLQILSGVNYAKKITEILEKQTKFEIIALKSAGNNRKIMEVQAILKSLKMQRVNLLKQCSSSISNSTYKSSTSGYKQRVSILAEDDSLRIMESIKKRIKPLVNPNLFNYADILDEYVSLTEDRIGENINIGSSSLRNSNEESRLSKQLSLKNNPTTSKEELKKQLSNLREKFNEIEGKAKVYQQNQLLKVNIEKIFQQLKRICKIFLPDQVIQQQENFQSLLQKIEERVRLSLYNKSKNSSPSSRELQQEDYQVDLKQLQLKIEQQCKNNSNLKKINISLIQENQKLTKKLSEKDIQLSQLRAQGYSKKKEEIQENGKLVQLKIDMEQLRQKLKQSEIKLNEASKKISNAQQQKVAILQRQNKLALQLRKAQEKIQKYVLIQSMQSQKIQHQDKTIKLTQRINQLEGEIKQMQTRYDQVLKKCQQIQKIRQQAQNLSDQLRNQVRNLQQKNKSIVEENNSMADQLMSAHQELQKSKQNAKTQRQKKQNSQIQALRVQIKQIQMKNADFVKQLEQEIQALQNQKKQLQQTVNKIQNELNQKQERISSLEQQNAKTVKNQTQRDKNIDSQTIASLNQKIEQQREQISNLSQRLESMKLTDKSLKSKNVFLQQKNKQTQQNYRHELEQLNNQLSKLIKQKQQIKLDLELSVHETTKLKEKQQSNQWQRKVQILQAQVKSKNQSLKNLQAINTELAESKIKIMEKYTDLQDSVQEKVQQAKKYREQAHLKEAQLERIAAQSLQKGQKVNRLQQQVRIRDKRIEDLANQKVRKNMNQRTYCNLIKRILRSQVQIQQFEDIEDFQKLLELGSQKVMVQRKRKRQQQSNQRRQVVKFDDEQEYEIQKEVQRNFTKAVQQNKVTLFTQEMQSQDGQKSIGQFEQSQSGKNKTLFSQSNIDSSPNEKKSKQEGIKDEDIQNLDDFGQYREQSLNQSLISQKDDQLQPQEKPHGNNFDQFNQIDQKMNNSMLSNKSEQKSKQNQQNQKIAIEPVQKEAVQQAKPEESQINQKQLSGADFSQFNDYNSESVNSSLISNQNQLSNIQKQQVVQQKQLIIEQPEQKIQQIPQFKKEEQGKDLQEFNDYKSENLNNSLLSNQQQNGNNQKNQGPKDQADFSQFADIKSENQNESLLSNQEPKMSQNEPQKDKQADFGEFNDYKSDKLNDSVISENIQNQNGRQGQKEKENERERENFSGADIDQFGDYQENMNSSMLSSQQQKIVALNKSSRSANSWSSKSLKSLKAGIQKMVSVKEVVQQKKPQIVQVNQQNQEKQGNQGNQFDAFNDYKSEHLNESVISEHQQSQKNQKEQGKEFQEFGQFDDKMNSSLISQGQNSRQKMNEDLSAIQFEDAGSQGLGNSHLSQFFHSADKRERQKQFEKQSQQKEAPQDK